MSKVNNFEPWSASLILIRPFEVGENQDISTSRCWSYALEVPSGPSGLISVSW